MKIPKQKKSNKRIKRIILVTSLAVLIALGLSVYAYAMHGSLFGWQPNPTSSDNEPVKSSPGITSNTDTTGTIKGGISNNNPGKTTDQVPVDTAIIASITDLRQSGGYIVFSGSTNDTRIGGKCSITFTNPNDHPISRTVGTTVTNSGAICGPVRIPETEFSYLGVWAVAFRYYVADVQAIVQKTITIQ